MQKDLDYTNIEHEACTCTRPQKAHFNHTTNLFRI